MPEEEDKRCLTETKYSGHSSVESPCAIFPFAFTAPARGFLLADPFSSLGAFLFPDPPAAEDDDEDDMKHLRLFIDVEAQASYQTKNHSTHPQDARLPHPSSTNPPAQPHSKRDAHPKRQHVFSHLQTLRCATLSHPGTRRSRGRWESRGELAGEFED